MHTEVAYLSIHAFWRGDIHIENTSCHVFIDNVTPKDSYFVVDLLINVPVYCKMYCACICCMMLFLK